MLNLFLIKEKEMKKPFKTASLLYLFLLFFCSCSDENPYSESHPTDMVVDLSNTDSDISPKENIKVEVKFPEIDIFATIQIEADYCVGKFVIAGNDFVLQINSIVIQNRCKTKNQVYYNVLAAFFGEADRILEKNISLTDSVTLNSPLLVASGKYVQILIRINNGDLRSGDGWCWFIPQGGIKGIVGEQEIVSPEIHFGTIVKK